MSSHLSSLSRFGRLGTGAMLFAALLVVGFAPLPIEWRITLTLGFAWATAAVALDLWQGYLGVLSFGHGVFVAIGAYTWTVLRMHEVGPATAAFGVILAAAVVAAISGAVVVQLNHFGAAVVTFFMAFIMFAYLSSSLSRPLTGGQGGLSVPPLEVLGHDLSEGRGLYFVALGLLLIVTVLTYHYAHSSSGRALEMIRENPLVASLLGVRVRRARLVAFVYSGSVAAIAGIVVAQVLMYVTPESFGAWQSIVLVAMVVVGGQRTILGAVVGAIAYQSLATAFQYQPDLQALYTALIFLTFVVLVPGGIASLAAYPAAILRSRAEVEVNAPGSPDPGNDVEVVGPHVPGLVPALVVTDARVEFAGVIALQDACLETRVAEIHALIGPNGAGKTTLINVITGIQASTSGRVELFGRTLDHLSPPRIREAGVSRTFQNPSLVDTLSIIDNVRLGLYSSERRVLAAELLTGTTWATQDRDATTRCGEALHVVGIPERLWSMPAGDVSFAVRKLADLARAIVHSPSVLLLDEPTAGISEQDIPLVENAIRNVRDRHGTTVVVVAHHVPFVRRLADRVTVLDAGSVLASGDPETVTRSAEVMEAFIGTATDEAPGRLRVEARESDPELPGPNHDGLRVRGLSVTYGKAVVLGGLDLDVRPGHVVALTGANGVGKTTALRALSGMTRSTADSISLGGAPLARRPHDAVRQGLAHVPEGRGVIAPMTVLENLRLGAVAAGRDIGRIEEVLDRFPRLRRLLPSKAGLLSGGEQQMLAIARGMLSDPKLLMIDELSLGLSPKAAQEALETVVTIAQDGPGLLLVDQNVGALAAVCDQIYIVKEGRSHLAESRLELAEITEQYF